MPLDGDDQAGEGESGKEGIDGLMAPNLSPNVPRSLPSNTFHTRQPAPAHATMTLMSKNAGEHLADVAAFGARISAIHESILHGECHTGPMTGVSLLGVVFPGPVFAGGTQLGEEDADGEQRLFPTPRRGGEPRSSPVRFEVSGECHGQPLELFDRRLNQRGGVLLHTVKIYSIRLFRKGLTQGAVPPLFYVEYAIYPIYLPSPGR